MTSWDYYIGFENEPSNLEIYLSGRGFSLIEELSDGIEKVFESTDPEGIDIYAHPFQSNEHIENNPDWDNSGTKITYEMLVTTKEGELFEELEKYILQKNLSSRIKINPNIFPKLSDIYVLTSTHEGYPNSYAEAILNGNSTLVTNYIGEHKNIVLENCCTHHRKCEQDLGAFCEAMTKLSQIPWVQNLEAHYQGLGDSEYKRCVNEIQRLL